jgi:hypothetical protein
LTGGLRKLAFWGATSVLAGLSIRCASVSWITELTLLRSDSHLSAANDLMLTRGKPGGARHAVELTFTAVGRPSLGALVKVTCAS